VFLNVKVCVDKVTRTRFVARPLLQRANTPPVAGISTLDHAKYLHDSMYDCVRTFSLCSKAYPTAVVCFGKRQVYVNEVQALSFLATTW